MMQKTESRALSEQSRIRYSVDMDHFAEWCGERNANPLPASEDAVTAYVSHLIGKGNAPATVKRALTAIRHAHRAGGFPPPRCPAIPAPPRPETNGAVGLKGARPVRLRELRRLVRSIDPGDTTGARDRALLLAGFFSAAWPSELLLVDIDRLVHGDDGVVLVRRTPSSRNEDEEDASLAFLPSQSDLELCPVSAIREWKHRLAERGVRTGPLFRRIDRHGRVFGEEGPIAGQSGRQRDGRLSVRGFSAIVQARGRLARMDTRRLSATSLRAGGLATALAKGYTPEDLAAYARYNPTNHALTLRLQPRKNHRGDPTRHGLALLD